MTVKSQNRQTKKLAGERIAILFTQAKVFAGINPAWSDRCVERARAIAMRQRMRMEREQRRQYCHHCYAYFLHGVNVRVRVHRGHVIVTCLNCGRQTRYQVVRTDNR
ncbi:ribonuclease P protein component 4 [Methanosphaerula palustris]|uniref:Ribonuclease P protein component 4 n=1 Tax=Methanosphaerula palustris (strain ATCC BAA-1556 / DSM 19958 / E1-9c) TaxID=521011 RepID=RNP4_METPE|nr:ribonuclease P [Methanosphaerula palustris]B8GET9.1 RecName: Full=Ribonuclease P protein component 4; Short=RNase P component 4; AltName: Full=Rpp21 [Methanosphaerula palustris E1-9c]ACL15906.1 RNAse P, Rpr2/Rpp21 subunit [Methanosphaerula palustris E1-9c]